MFPAFVLHQPIGATRDIPTELVVTESQLTKGLIEMNPHALDYVKRENDRQNVDNTDQMYLRYKLEELQTKWERATAFSSAIDEIVRDENFKAIISYGENIVPVILNSLKQNPSHLVWALNFITNRTISSKPISITEASKAWVDWGLRNKLIE
jgi:hypothetical protein